MTSNGNFVTKLSLAFMTASSFDFKSLRKETLPTQSVSIDVWILRDQEILLTKNSKQDDEIVNLMFSGFSKTMERIFAQTVTPTKQAYNQGLVLENGVFQFVPMNTSNVYEVNSNKDMSQVYKLFSQLIDQDQKFLSQLQSFQTMLIQSKVFKNPSSTPPPENHIGKRSPIILGEHLLHLNNKSVKLRFTRNIADIFTPYSVQSIGDTAGQNYKKMNKNFQVVQVVEQKLSHQQRTLAAHFVSLTTAEKNTQRKELYLELRAFRTSYFHNFMFDLAEILKHNSLDPVYDILFSLIRQHEFCHSVTCYTLPIFSILNATSIQVSVQTAQQSLAPAVYISCTLQPNLRTSVFSHQIALIDGDKLNFQADQLPSISFAQLINPSIDQTTRSLLDTDMIFGELYLIYSGLKVSLQCLHPQMITIDGVERYCDRTSLNFVDFPEQIKVGTKDVLKVSIPHHFSSKLDFLNTDLRSVSIFQPTNSTALHFGNKIVNFFQTASPIHYSFMFVLFVCVLLVCVLSCCFFYLKFPQCLYYTLCCFRNTCLIKQKVIKRSFDIGIIAGQAEARLQNQESLLQNENIIFRAEPIIQPRPDIPLVQLQPTAPANAQQYHLTRQVPGNPTFTHPQNCRNRVNGCFCSDPNYNQPQCLIATQVNPMII